MFEELITIAIPCSVFCGLLAIGGAISDYILYKQDKTDKKLYRHRYDKIKLMYTAEMTAIAHPYLEDSLECQ